MTNDVVLSVQDLHVYFYTNRRCNKVLNGVSFDVKSGQTLCIVGESGCGKSVTAKAIMQLLPELSRIERGTIRYFRDGQEIAVEGLERNGSTMRHLRGEDMAMIFQDPMTALNPVFTVGFQIGEMIREHNRGISRAETRAREIAGLRDMGISAPEQRVREYPHQYSGGMRQRAMIAMAMSCSPRILIADEPTTALDVTISAQIFDLMHKLRVERGTAIVLITHNMGVVAEMADNVAVMYMGQIVEMGTAEDVLSRPAHPYTQALLRSIPVLGRGRNQVLEPIRGSTPDPFNRPKGCQFCPRCDEATPECETVSPEVVRLSETHMTRCLCRREARTDA